MKNEETPTLEESAAQLGAIPLHSTDLLTLVDTDGVIQYESPAIEQLYGYDQSELIGEQVADYFHPDDRPEVVAAFQAVVDADDHHVEAVEYRHKIADGRYKWIESVASANPTPEGNYVINSRDISARKERDRALERQNKRLDRFASVISHDLRNPLAVAQGYLELAKKTGEEADFQKVADAHDRMATMIAELLTLAQAETNIDDSACEPVPLETAVTKAWATTETQGATLETELPAVLCCVAAPSILRNIFENLFRNAAEHNEPPVTVTVGSCEDGFFVEDDGTGIPAESREEVFAYGSTTATDGTGLGLAIVDDLATAHGWEIQLMKSDSGGARFEITACEIVRK